MTKKNLIISGVALAFAIICAILADFNLTFLLGVVCGGSLLLCISYTVGAVIARRMMSQTEKVQRDYIDMMRVEEAVQKSE